MRHNLYNLYVPIFASRGPIQEKILAELIIKAIILLENSKATIYGGVTGTATNRKFSNVMGISRKKMN